MTPENNPKFVRVLEREITLVKILDRFRMNSGEIYPHLSEICP